MLYHDGIEIELFIIIMFFFCRQRQSVKQNEVVRGENYHHHHAFSPGIGSNGGSSSSGSSGADTSFQHGYRRRPTADVGAGRLLKDEDLTGSGSEQDSTRPSILMVKDEGRRSTSRIERSSSAVSQDKVHDQRSHSHYQQYHHLENYQRVERSGFPRHGPGEGPCRCHSHSHPRSRSQPQPSHQHQYQHQHPGMDVEVDVKPRLLLSSGVPSRLYPSSSRGSSVQTTAYHSDPRSYPSPPSLAPRVYSSSDITSSDESIVYKRPDLDSLPGRYVIVLTLALLSFLRSTWQT